MKRIALVAGCWLIASSAVASETGPVIVIPGRPGVPIIINGHDVSYSVIEGDWGLARPSYIAPQVIYRPYFPTEVGPAPAANYFPKTGRKPRYGRLERDVPRPQQAQSYNRGWGVASDPTPVTIPAPYPTPPIVVTPDLRRRHRP
jgi:hypothetical protein